MSSLIPKLRFSNFQSKWEKLPINSLGKVITGNTPPTSNSSFYGGSELFVSPADMGYERYILKTRTNLTEKGFSKGRVIKARSALFVCIGSTIGKVAIAGKDCVTNQQINAIEFSDDFVPEFVYPILEKYALKIKRFAGEQAVPIINKSEFSKFKLPVSTCIEEQQKIADFLTAVDSKISLLTEKHRLLKAYKKGVMQQLFSQQIRFKDDDGKVFPEWKVERIGKYLELYRELVSANTEIPILTSSRTGLYPQERAVINEGDYGVVPLGYFTYRHMSDDLVFKFNVNRLWDKGAVSKEYPVFKTVGMDSYFLELQLNEGNDFKRFAIQQKQGGTRTRLYFKNLKELKLNLPSLKEQQKIAQCLQALDNKINAVAEQIEQTKLFKKGLLQQMFV
ncbi:restriction endonuclease subunit S [Shewanella colwelliana]|uniref:restriction endonuclease subunit S n=1 Tax=Shewanella colwelliana TaxID=23 RepID=UPI003D018F39